MQKLFVAVALTALLSACAGTSQIAVVNAAQVTLGGLELTGTQYLNLPPCGGTIKVCSDPAMSAKIKAADNTAYAAIVAARKSAEAGQSVDMTATNAALAGLLTLVQQIPAAPPPAAPATQ